MKKRYQVSADSPSMRRIVAVLSSCDEALTGREIAERAHVSFKYFQNQARHILIAAEAIHLADLRHNTRGPFVPAYRAGPEPEGLIVRKPAKIDQLERARTWKVRSGYNEARKAERRLRRPPDRALAALIGI